MTASICIPPAAFESIVQSLPHLTVEADETRQYVVIDGVEFSTPLQPLGGAS